ncbi:uncharacterized protein SCHCODRAFT_02223451 [Schizophyllum commune H4-8]|uniref:uncharacterized protein n=1 Tax=Schizophyllum commune (strain H4-8 / FGSC 9210) TaxID=578458 RepID=UPI00215ECFDB|nr:uncharacterized protein SCHCODRAFT_02223451 [Schizophyllum commune H4-8]KAI5895094.1 hypothetical protein SCHCODRAFT_02223451 [Schizophyllum commune H4-8]
MDTVATEALKICGLWLILVLRLSSVVAARSVRILLRSAKIFLYSAEIFLRSAVVNVVVAKYAADLGDSLTLGVAHAKSRARDAQRPASCLRVPLLCATPGVLPLRISRHPRYITSRLSCAFSTYRVIQPTLYSLRRTRITLRHGSPTALLQLAEYLHSTRSLNSDCRAEFPASHTSPPTPAQK